MNNYFEVLHVDESADSKTIKKAYRTLAKKYHPDATKLPQLEADKMMVLLNEAYQVLSDDARRKKYLEQLRSSNYSCSSFDKNKESHAADSRAKGTDKSSTSEEDGSDSNYRTNGAYTNRYEDKDSYKDIDPASRIIGGIIIGIVIVSIISCIAYFVPDTLRDALYMLRRTLEDFFYSFR